MKPTITRPKTAAEVTVDAESLKDFGFNLKDWQHELKYVSSRDELARRVADAPRPLQDVFSGGDTCDAYLAAYVDYLCRKASIATPAWAHEVERVAAKPWFSLNTPRAQKILLVKAPTPFRERNIFTQPENPIVIRRGRPAKSVEAKRKANAERQRRWRERRKVEK